MNANFMPLPTNKSNEEGHQFGLAECSLCCSPEQGKRLTMVSHSFVKRNILTSFVAGNLNLEIRRTE